MKNILNIMIVFMVLAGCSTQSEESQAQQQAMPVPVGHPVEKKVMDWDEYTGRFISPSRVEVRARVSGFLDDIKFEDGQFVEKDDVLFIIDQRPYQIELSLAQAQWQQSSAELKRAKNDYERVQKLKETNAVSAEELDQREQTMYAAQAQLEAAQARVDQAQLHLEYTKVRAPISGYVSRDFVQEGNLITGSNAGPASVTTLLTTIVNNTPLYFYFEVSESEWLRYRRMNRNLLKLEKSIPVFVQLLDEKDFIHEGHIDFVDNELDLDTGTIELRAVFNNDNDLLQSGMFGRARVPVGEEYEAVLVSDSLIRSNQSQKFIYTVGSDNVVQVTNIDIGRLDNDMRVIKSGLSIKDVIITGNTQMLRPGMPVIPQQDEATKSQHGESVE